MGGRIAGVILSALSLMVMAVLWLWPANLTILGTDISCGMPAVTSTLGRTAVVDGELERAVLAECVTQSTIRVAVGAGIGGIGTVGGLVAIVAGGRRPAPTPAPPPVFRPPVQLFTPDPRRPR